MGLSSLEELIVVDEDTGTEWMEVRTPRIGRFFVLCDDIIDASEVNQEPNSAYSRLRSLSLSFEEFEPGTVSAFIRLVGHNLTALSIPCQSRRWVTTSDVKKILQACPNLQVLMLECVELESMDAFIQAYERGWCSMTTLSLWDVMVSNESLVKFATKLEDPQHPMTRRLTEFRYVFNDISDPTAVRLPDERGIQAFFPMLQVNERLHFFELGVEGRFYQHYAPLFKPLDGQELRHKTRGLSSRCKLALLSAIKAKSSVSRIFKRRRQHPGAYSRALDKASVRRIFSYCEREVVRHVSITEIVLPSATVAHC